LRQVYLNPFRRIAHCGIVNLPCAKFHHGLSKKGVILVRHLLFISLVVSLVVLVSSVAFAVSVQPTPEPGTLALMGVGLPLAGLWWRNRKRS
jgi:archaellum biogenesis protein FlaJ (TadC family)